MVKNSVYRLLQFLIGWPLSVLAIIFIFKLISPQIPTLLSEIDKVSIPMLIFAIICFLVYYFIRGYIWKIMIRHGGHKMSYKDANFIWAASEIKRYIPGNIWSFLGRAIMFAEKGIDKKDVAKYSLIEMQLIVLGSLNVALLSIPFVSNYYHLQQNFITAVAVAILAITIFYIYNSKLKLKIPFLPDFKPQKILILLLLNILMFVAFGFGYYFTFISFATIDASLMFQLVGFSVLSFIIGYLSILTPSGLGVREGTLIFGLSKIVSVSAAGFLALFSRFVLIIAELIYVVFSYLWKNTENTSLRGGTTKQSQ